MENRIVKRKIMLILQVKKHYYPAAYPPEKGML